MAHTTLLEISCGGSIIVEYLLYWHYNKVVVWDFNIPVWVCIDDFIVKKSNLLSPMNCCIVHLILHSVCQSTS